METQMTAIAMPRMPTRAAQPATRTRGAAARASWLERLAEWAERQPTHRRVGSWTLACAPRRRHAGT
ncbi:MAG: hypothetical protein HYZ20_13190 [Burkholderiales bacterium]|nr:hypothetical protein [Burkholderiales bacterium]